MFELIFAIYSLHCLIVVTAVKVAVRLAWDVNSFISRVSQLVKSCTLARNERCRWFVKPNCFFPSRWPVGLCYVGCIGIPVVAKTRSERPFSASGTTAQVKLVLGGPDSCSPVIEEIVERLIEADVWLPANLSLDPTWVTHQEGVVGGAKAFRIDNHLYRYPRMS